MVVNPIMVNNFAFLFGYMLVGQDSDSMTAPAKSPLLPGALALVGLVFFCFSQFWLCFLNAKPKAEEQLVPIFKVFGMTWREMEPTSS